MLTPPQIKLLAGAVGVVALLAAFAGWTWAVQSWGYDRGIAKGEAAIAAANLSAQTARADAEKARADFAERVLVIEQDASRRIEEARAKTPARIATVGKSLNENPAFAAMVRPADLQRVRDEQLAELAAAAGRSADLSAAGLAAVRRPDRSAGADAQ